MASRRRAHSMADRLSGLEIEDETNFSIRRDEFTHPRLGEPDDTFRPAGQKRAAQYPDAFALPRVRIAWIAASQAIQEIDQIGFLLVGETDGEALIIKVHHVL
jgi:hypothetical protein